MMEFELPLTIILVVSSLFIVFKLLKKSESDDALLLNRIPGPKRLPVIGNLHLLAGKSPPHHVFRELAAEYGPLMRLQLGSIPFIIVSSVEAAKHVLKTHDTVFANRPQVLASKAITYNFTDIGGAPYGEYWRHLRKICTLELLSGRRVRSFRLIREEVNSNLARSFASREGSPSNLSDGVYQSSFDITTRASIGKESEEKREMMSAVKVALKMVSGLCLADLFPSNPLIPLITGMSFKIHKLFRQTDRILQRILDAHTAGNEAMGRSEDLVDLLLKYKKADAEMHLTDDNIKAVIMDMFLAGGETSATTVDWAISEMVRNPTTFKLAQDEVRHVFDNNKGVVDEEKFEELKYLKLVIKETLRMHPPLPLLVPRQSSARCEINGYEIPPNSRVMVNAWALGGDPKYWNDAEKFKPERFEDSSLDFKGSNLEYIPFGSGRRICPGMSFGLATVEFSLAMLLYHFDWKMPNGMTDQDLDMTEDFGVTVKRKQDLVLVPTLKRPLLS